MKKYIVALSLLTLAACTKSSTSSTTPTATGAAGASGTSGDTTFNGSYFKLSVNGKNFNVKDTKVSISYGHMATVSSTSMSWMLPDGSTTTQVTVSINDLYSIYGLGGMSSWIFFYGTGTGTFPMHVSNSTPSYLAQENPALTYQDTTGHVTITHNGGDYLEGTFTANLYYSTFTYPATGSFKVYH